MAGKAKLLLIGAGIVGGVVLLKKLRDGINVVNPFSDQNAAYQGANTIVQYVTGNTGATVGTAVYDALHPNAAAYDPNSKTATASDSPLTNLILKSNPITAPISYALDNVVKLFPEGDAYPLTPSATAPYWYNADGSKRTKGLPYGGSAWDASGRLLYVNKDGNARYAS